MADKLLFLAQNDSMAPPFSHADLQQIIDGIMSNQESWGGRVVAYAAFFQIAQTSSVQEDVPSLSVPFEGLDMFTKVQLDKIRTNIFFPPSALDNAKDEIGLGYSLVHKASTGLFFFHALSGADIVVIDVEDPVPAMDEEVGIVEEEEILD